MAVIAEVAAVETSSKEKNEDLPADSLAANCNVTEILQTRRLNRSLKRLFQKSPLHNRNQSIPLPQSHLSILWTVLQRLRRCM